MVILQKSSILLILHCQYNISPYPFSQEVIGIICKLKIKRNQEILSQLLNHLINYSCRYSYLTSSKKSLIVYDVPK